MRCKLSHITNYHIAQIMRHKLSYQRTYHSARTQSRLPQVVAPKWQRLSEDEACHYSAMRESALSNEHNSSIIATSLPHSSLENQFGRLQKSGSSFPSGTVDIALYLIEPKVCLVHFLDISFMGFLIGEINY